MKKVKSTGGPNGIAKDLRTPKYRSRVVKNRKAYTRKGRKEKGSHEAPRFSFCR